MEHSRIKSLDGLRAFAIIFVLLSHSLWKITDIYDEAIILKIGSINFYSFLYNGWFGVDLFFVLSGFLISSQLLKNPLNKSILKKFFARRYFRIAPAYYVSIFFTVIIIHILPNLNQNSLSELFAIWWYPILAHIIFLHDYIGREPVIDGLFWSIPIEMKFYMILPLIIYFIVKLKKNIHQIYLIIGFYSFYLLAKISYLYFIYKFNIIDYKEYFLYIKTPFHFALDGLIIGVLSSFILRNDKIKNINKMTFNMMFLMGLIIFYIASSTVHFSGGVASFFEYSIMNSLFSIGFGLILISLVSGCSATKFFSNFVLIFIARISYSMYLTHLSAIYLDVGIIAKLHLFIDSITLCWIISLPMFFGLAIIMAYLLYNFVEEPMIKWSKQKWS